MQVVGFFAFHWFGQWAAAFEGQDVKNILCAVNEIFVACKLQALFRAILDEFVIHFYVLMQCYMKGQCEKRASFYGKVSLCRREKITACQAVKFSSFFPPYISVWLWGRLLAVR